MLKRVFDPPPPTLDSSSFEALVQKRKLSELRASVLDGSFEASWRRLHGSDDSGTSGSGGGSGGSSGSDDSDGGGAASAARSSGKLRHRSGTRADAESPDQPSLDPEWQREQLAEVRRHIEEEQAASRSDKQAERQKLAAEQDAVIAELADVKERLQGIKGEKHEAVQQLKRVGWCAVLRGGRAGIANTQGWVRADLTVRSRANRKQL